MNQSTMLIFQRLVVEHSQNGPITDAQAAALRVQASTESAAAAVTNEAESLRYLQLAKEVILESVSVVRNVWQGSGLPDNSYALIKPYMVQGSALVTCERGGAAGTKERLSLGHDGRSVADFIRTVAKNARPYHKRDDVVVADRGPRD